MGGEENKRRQDITAGTFTGRGHTADFVDVVLFSSLFWPLAVAIIRYMAQVGTGLRLDEELLARVDEARGDVPRARWIARACEQELERVARVGLGEGRFDGARKRGGSRRAAVEQALGESGGTPRPPSDAARAASPAPAEQPTPKLSRPPGRSLPRQHSPTCPCPVCHPERARR